MNKLYIRSGTVKSKAVDTDINDIAIGECNSTIAALKQNKEAKEKLNDAKANQQKDYETLIKIISYLVERLDVNEFKSMVTTDLKLKSIIAELKRKLCNIENI